MPLAAIDRLAPTRRPAGRARGYQQWRDLLFLHWEVPADLLRSLVPSALDLDRYQDRAFVGVVPFAMQGVRPRWWPGTGFAFLEANVRTYVLHRDRPGVYFFSLDAADRLAVWAARRFWGLPYYYAHMTLQKMQDEVHYTVKRHGSDAAFRVRYQIEERLGESQPGSAEFFFLERYLLFVQRQGRIEVGQVYHTPYPAHAARVLQCEEGLAAAIGLPAPDVPPQFAHYAAGVDVEVFSLRPVPSAGADRPLHHAW